MRCRLRRALTLGVLACLCLSGLLFYACDGDDDDRQVLQVYAASSLKEAFLDLEEAFEREHPNADVQLNFAGSQVLRLQIEQGAPADVYASANEDHMKALQRAELMGESVDFAFNRLAVIVPRSNPAGITRFAELPRSSRLVLGNENVPIGHYTEGLLDAAADHLGAGFREEVENGVVSRESNVRLVRGKVELGEADAAIVYSTDASASDLVRTIAIPRSLEQQVRYPIAVARGSGSAELAENWIDFVRSPAGQEVLAKHGFQTNR